MPTILDIGQIVREIDRELRALGTAERAVQEKRYLKSALEHYGTTVPNIRSVAKSVRRRYPELGHDELLNLYGAALQRRDMKLLERLLRESRTRALVDGLSTGYYRERRARRA